MLYHLSCPLHHQPGSNVHGHQLLEQQLGCIRELHLRYLSFVLASLAFKCVVPQISDCNQSTEVTHMDPVWI